MQSAMMSLALALSYRSQGPRSLIGRCHSGGHPQSRLTLDQNDVGGMIPAIGCASSLWTLRKLDCQVLRSTARTIPSIILARALRRVGRRMDGESRLRVDAWMRLGTRGLSLIGPSVGVASSHGPK